MEPQPYETTVDKQIRLAQEQGAFDNLPGKGKPLRGIDQPHNDNWWIDDWMKREGVSVEALLPPSIQLRKEIDRLPDALRGMPTEGAVRDTVTELNGRIVAFLRAPQGPKLPIHRIDVDAAVQRWRAEHPAPVERAEPAAPPPPARRRWWQRRG
ncbi:DUF1992 domain-containing protein [Pseudonocardia sp. GCM10023141]|uniref:DnaJ family domain-containing protein n=1 Tax=Pseudonocardia sp. GCM10023141 TaxID=3252653 RepID=UPI00361389BA